MATEQNYNETAAADTLAQQKLGQGQGVSGGPGISQSFSRAEEKGKSKKVTFTHTYFHFIGPGTDRAGGAVESNSNDDLCFTYDIYLTIMPELR